MINSEKLLDLSNTIHPMAVNLLVSLVVEAAFYPESNRKRGQVVTTLKKLAGSGRNTQRNREKALKILKGIGEISVENLDGNSLIITVLHFDNSPYWKFKEVGE